MSFIERFNRDIECVFERDPAATSKLEVVLNYPGLHAIWMHRITHRLYNMHMRVLARFLSQVARFFTQVEIHPGAQLGEGLFIDHGCGIVIGETTVVGDNCTIYQGVTLGGVGTKKGKRHPTIGNNVMISAGAKIIGSFTVGDNSKIGAGSVVIEEVPPNCTVVGVPGRVVKRDNIRTPQDDMDQVHLPDPVKEDITVLQHENAELVNRVLDLEKEVRILSAGAGASQE